MFSTYYLLKLYLPGGQKHQIWHSVSERNNKKIHLLSQREFSTTLAQSREIY